MGAQTACEGFTANCPYGDSIQPGDEIVLTWGSWYHQACVASGTRTIR